MNSSIVNPKYIYLSVSLEILSLGFLFKLNSLPFLFLFLISHGIAMFLLCSVLAIFIPRRIRDKKISPFILFILNFPTLYIGYVSMFILVLYIMRKQKSETYNPHKMPTLREIATENIKFSGRKFGEAAAINLTTENNFSDVYAEKIISYLSTLKTPKTISIFKKTLTSREDLTKLYSFAVLYKLEKEINEKIHFFKNKLNQNNNMDIEDKAYTLYSLASLYFNLVYLNIADQELRDFMLKEALINAQKSLELNPTPEVMLLLAKIYIKLKEFDKSMTYLEEIKKTKDFINPIKYVLELAEIYYERKKYQEIKKLFKNYPILAKVLDPRINFIVQFWIGDASSNR